MRENSNAVMLELTLEADSDDYDVLFDSARHIKGVPGFTCEIGLRRGAGSEAIVRGCLASGDRRTHVGIDPYGHIVYELAPSCRARLYPNDMKRIFLKEFHQFCHAHDVDFLFFCMEDVEFFERFADGVPVYFEEKSLVNEYALVHFDGPHGVGPVLREMNFFAPRTPAGGIWVVDDIDFFSDTYAAVEQHVLLNGFDPLVRKTKKASYIKRA